MSVYRSRDGVAVVAAAVAAVAAAVSILEFHGHRGRIRGRAVLGLLCFEDVVSGAQHDHVCKVVAQSKEPKAAPVAPLCAGAYNFVPAVNVRALSRVDAGPLHVHEPRYRYRANVGTELKARTTSHTQGAS